MFKYLAVDKLGSPRGTSAAIAIVGKNETGTYNFLTDIANFRQNSDRQQHISGRVLKFFLILPLYVSKMVQRHVLFFWTKTCKQHFLDYLPQPNI